MNIDILTVKEKDILKSNGRYGDTELDQVDGEVQHTNKWEHKFLKKAKENGQTKKAEALLAVIGSKSKNPFDGLTENSMISAAFEGDIDTWTWDSLWDKTMGRDGLGSLFGGGGQDSLRSQAKGIANEGFETTLKAAENDLGPDGAIMKAKGDELDVVQNATSMKSEQIAAQEDSLVSKSGFATSGPAQQMGIKNQMDLIKESNTQSEMIVDNAVNETQDVVLNLNQQKNATLSAYMTATDKEFGGSSQLNELQAYIDSYGDV
tara:strand:+ start:4695 stop:5483 length:789 start_codon:yes stop_codon:yes gene_type:complete